MYESKPAFFTDPFFLREADWIKDVLHQLQDPKRMEAMHTSSSAQQYKKPLEVASRNVKKLSDSGAKIAADTGPPARFQGYFEHMELDLMAKAGLTPAQILKSATGDAAACMQMAGKVGTLQPGAWGDLIVLERNPLDDIKNMRTIQSVWIAGNKVATW